MRAAAVVLEEERLLEIWRRVEERLRLSTRSMLHSGSGSSA